MVRINIVSAVALRRQRILNIVPNVERDFNGDKR